MFAEQHERNEAVRILFPRDKKYREQFFAPESFTHPAKCNLYLIEAIIRTPAHPKGVSNDNRPLETVRPLL